MKMSISVVILISILAMKECTQPDVFDEKRKKMVETQIRRRGIQNDDVLDAMRKVPRHLFVPKDMVSKAYEDGPLPVGYGQTISQPYVVAFMTEAVCGNNPGKVLEIGTGSGYQAAVLAEICDSVYTIEIVEQLSKRAESTLKSLGYKNVFVKTGNGYLGWEEHAPFDAIIVTCAPWKIPEALKNQLAEGGKMIIPVGGSYSQELILVRKRNGKLYQESVLPVMFVPMVDEPGSQTK